jgi:O-antigen/teichoic acid export membrane protein
MKRVSRNAAAILGSDLLRRLLGFFSVTYLARIIGTEGFGAINIGFTALSYCIVLSSAGLPSYGAREVARTGESGVVGRVVGARLRNALVIFALTAMLVLAVIGSSEIRLLILIFSSSVFVHSVLLEWYFQGHEEMHPIGVSRMVSAVVYLLILLVAVNSPADLYLVGVASVCADVIAAAYLLRIYLRKQGTFSIRMTTAEWFTLDRISLPFGIGSILGQISLNLPVIVLGVLVTASDVGVFSAATKIVFFLLMFDRLLGTLLLPASSRIHAIRPEQLSGVLSIARKWVLVIAVPLCAGGSILAPRLMVGLFGDAFFASGDVFRVLVWFLPLTLLHTVYTSGLIAAGREKQYSRVMMISVCIYAVTIIAGVLFSGVTGAAAAITVSEFVTLVLMWKKCSEVVRIPFDSTLVMTVISGGVMAGAVVLLQSTHLLILIPAGAAIYTALLFSTGALRLAEVRSMMERLK